jgi:hypothetical protein
MTSKVRLAACSAAAALAFTAGAARAQYSGGMGMTFNNPVSSFASTVIMDNIMKKNVMGYGKGSRAPGRTPTRMVAPGGGAASAAARQPVGTTTFRPGPRAILGRFPEARRQQAAQVLATCDKVYAATMSQSGVISSQLDVNDLSTSTAFYMAISHYIYWDGQPGAPISAQPAHVKTLRAKLRDRYLLAGTMTSQNDLQKQAAHDSLVFTACIPMLQYTQAKKANNEPAKQKARASAADLLRRVGLTPAGLRFNPNGSVLIAGVD